MLEKLRQQRAAKRAELDVLTALDEPTTEQRDQVKALLADIKEMDERIGEVEDLQAREARHAAAQVETGNVGREERSTPRAVVTSEPETYRKGGANSFFRDVFRAQTLGDRDAYDRLVRNAREVTEQRALTTTDGAGGEFVPPLWMINEYVALARAARPTADRVRQQALPGGTDTINLPRVASGTAVAEQATQNTSVQNTDATTNSVTAAVATLAGQQVISQQLIDQSPINMDAILLADLAADYATKLDVFVLNNNAANKRGLLNVSGLNAVTYTSTTPTVAELYPKLANAIQQVHTGRFLPPDTIVMHPRRWAWLLAAVDSQGRPFVVPAAQSPMNSAGQQSGVVAQGMVGSIQGVDVIVDPSVPTNLGAGTNEDRIIVMRSSDVILFEGTPRAEAFRETKADQLSVLLRFFNYAALHSERYPKAISVISGTGLVAPTF